MYIIKIILILSLILLSACDNKKNEDKIATLEDKIATLNQKLQKAQDPAEIDAIQKKLNQAAAQKFDEMMKKRTTLADEIENTKDKESCEKLQVQIDQLMKDLNQHIIDYSGLQFFGGRSSNGTCTEEGFTWNKVKSPSKSTTIDPEAKYDPNDPNAPIPEELR